MLSCLSIQLMPACLYIYLSVLLFVYLSVHLSACPYLWPSYCNTPFIYLTIFLSVCLPACLPVYLFVCLSTHHLYKNYFFLSVYLPVCLSICMYVCIYVYLSVRPSVCLPVHTCKNSSHHIAYTPCILLAQPPLF